MKLKLESGRAVRMQVMTLVRPEWWQVRAGEKLTECIFFFFNKKGRGEGGREEMEERGKRKRGREDKKKKADLNPGAMNNY